MLQVEMIDECHFPGTLQIHINNKIRELHKRGCEVIDVKYSFIGDETQQYFTYTAMIVYKTRNSEQ
jgi:hypothetical protein